jgi:hypothetical protein
MFCKCLIKYFCLIICGLGRDNMNFGILGIYVFEETLHFGLLIT